MKTNVQSGSVSPAFKVRRRTASDATWKNRPRTMHEPNEEVVPGACVVHCAFRTHGLLNVSLL